MIDIKVGVTGSVSDNWEDLPIEMHTVLANFIEEWWDFPNPLTIVFDHSPSLTAGRCTMVFNYIIVRVFPNSPCLGAILAHELGHAYYFAKGDDRRNTEINADLFAVRLGCEPELSMTDVIFGNESEVEYERKFNIALEGYYAKNN